MKRRDFFKTVAVAAVLPPVATPTVTVRAALPYPWCAIVPAWPSALPDIREAMMHGPQLSVVMGDLLEAVNKKNQEAIL